MQSYGNAWKFLNYEAYAFYFDLNKQYQKAYWLGKFSWTFNLNITKHKFKKLLQ